MGRNIASAKVGPYSTSAQMTHARPRPGEGTPCEKSDRCCRGEFRPSKTVAIGVSFRAHSRRWIGSEPPHRETNLASEAVRAIVWWQIRLASLLNISAETAGTTARSVISPHKRAFPRNEPVPTDGLRSQRVLVRSPERVARQHAEAVRERGDVGRVGGVVALEVINEEAGADPLYRGERAVGPLEVAVGDLQVSGDR